MNELSLFSGYGGFSLGLRLAGLDITTVGYVEIEPYCQEIIKARIKDGYLDDAPIFPDIRAFDGEQCRGLVDIITAGFPCQAHSVAGQRRGAEDERNLWPDTFRVVSEVQPQMVLLENVQGVSSYIHGEVEPDLYELGYTIAPPYIGSAAELGAGHHRRRHLVFAYADKDEIWLQHRRCEWSSREKTVQPKQATWWAREPTMDRVANGTSYRVDRLKALGNGVVPAVVAEFLQRIQ